MPYKKGTEGSTFSYIEVTVNVPFCIQWCFIIKINKTDKRMCDESLFYEPEQLSLDSRNPGKSQVQEDGRQRQANSWVVM